LIQSSLVPQLQPPPAADETASGNCGAKSKQVTVTLRAAWGMRCKSNCAELRGGPHPAEEFLLDVVDLSTKCNSTLRTGNPMEAETRLVSAFDFYNHKELDRKNRNILIRFSK